MHYVRRPLSKPILCLSPITPYLSSIGSDLTMVHNSTPLLQDWLGDDAAKRHRREIHFPSGRFGEAIEQAQAVLFLASDESSFVNGTDFVVDGGMTKVCSSVVLPRTHENSAVENQTLANRLRRHMSRRKGQRLSPPKTSQDESIRGRASAACR